MNDHFEKYLQSVKEYNINPKISKYTNLLPDSIVDFKNLTIYGPPGCGKYSQALYLIEKYSPSHLKYEKKINYTYNKQEFEFKLSDIHFEIDLNLLGCNSKIIWNEIFNIFMDIVATKPHNTGIILCKNFHNIHNDLLDIFYSYIQDNMYSPIKIKFILITEHISFIPNNILLACEQISISRPSKTQYNKITNTKINIPLSDVANIKNITNNTNELNKPYKMICDKIISNIINYKQIKFIEFRDLLYNIFIFNLNINDCIYYILFYLIQNNYIKNDDMHNILIKTYDFFKLYNNNYRPIYHLESYIFYLISKIHELQESAINT